AGLLLFQMIIPNDKSGLKYTDRLSQGIFDRLFQVLHQPKIQISKNYISPHLTEVTVIADAQGINIDKIVVCFKKYDGISLLCDTLYDDGFHNDGLALDNVFGNIFQIVPQKEGLYLDADVTYNTGQSYTLCSLAENISTAGSVSIVTYSVASDNLNNDGIVNPGENIRYIFSLENNSKFSLNNVYIEAIPNSEFNTIRIANLDSSSTYSLVYNPSDANSYFTFNIPSNYYDNTFNDSTFKINIKIRDADYNVWQDSLRFFAKPFPNQIRETPITPVSGLADGNFEILIVNPSEIRNHMYVIWGVDSINTAKERGFILKDSTDGRILLLNHPLPNQYSHNIPLTDGFKIFKGNLNTDSTGVKRWEVPSGTRRFTWLNSSIGLEGFNGALGWASPASFFGSGIKGVSAHKIKNVLLKLATVDVNGNYNTNDPNVSYGYRYGRRFDLPPAQPQFAPFIINQGTTGGYIYQDFTKSVPLSAWDVEANPPRRLVVGHLENNVSSGMVDGKYWPPAYYVASNNTVREWLWIFDATYSEIPNPAFQVEAILNPLPIMYFATWSLDGNVPFTTGDEFLIIAHHIISSNDSWIFNPTTVLGSEEFNVNAFQLYQNYPNPFNPNTSISYNLPAKSFVKLKIFNILGQEIITLIDEMQYEGHQSVIWNGRNKSGNSIASGVYFYKIDAVVVNGPSKTFVQVRKMLLVK
ncbi:MAG: T9SS type A sorting domain-containing protein, partial [Bacteroidota bacterium]|nr:T9SS type A sorting domain-containing protein [Bacteroidota bacterium]